MALFANDPGGGAAQRSRAVTIAPPPADAGVDMEKPQAAARGRSSMRRRQCRAGYAFVAPALVLTAIFFFLPMAFSLWWSFTKYNGVTEPKYVGFNNYADLFADDRFRTAVGNTAIFALVTMTIGPILGLVSALLLNRARVPVAFSCRFLPSRDDVPGGRLDDVEDALERRRADQPRH